MLKELIGGGNFIFIALAIFLFLRSFRTIQQGTIGVVTIFGKYRRVLPPGLNFTIPFIEVIFKRISTQNRSVEMEFQAVTVDQANVYFKSMLLYSVIDANEETIKKHLASIKYKRTTVFGHFGYHGSLNSAGDNDFRIPLECFNNLTFLGHIHHYSATDKVVVVGTPYTTSFQEAGKPNYVVYYKHNGRKASWEAVTAVGGPRHHVCKIEDLHELNLEKENFNLVRVMMNPLKELNDLDIISQIKTNYPLINWVDLRFNTITDNKVEQSYYRPDRQLFNINEAIIEDYIDSSATALDKKDLLAGLKDLDEDQ